MGRGWASGGLLGPAGPAPWKPPFLWFPWCSLRSHRGPSRPPAPAAFPGWGQARMLRTPQFLLHSHASQGKRRGRPLRGAHGHPKHLLLPGAGPPGVNPHRGLDCWARSAWTNRASEPKRRREASWPAGGLARSPGAVGAQAPRACWAARSPPRTAWDAPGSLLRETQAVPRLPPGLAAEGPWRHWRPRCTPPAGWGPPSRFARGPPPSRRVHRREVVSECTSHNGGY